MKGDACGFLHQFDPERMPTCKAMLRHGTCREPDCPYKHTLDDVKECNMYRLGFCVYGPTCRYRHTRLPGPAPPPHTLEAARPRELRNVNAVVNSVNVAITASRTERAKILAASRGRDGGRDGGRAVGGRPGGGPLALPAAGGRDGGPGPGGRPPPPGGRPGEPRPPGE